MPLPIAAPASSRIYCRPTGLIDAPFGYDGQFARLAGGMQFFSAWEVIAADQGKRAGQWLVPVDRIDEALEGLSPEQREGASRAMNRATSPRSALKLGERIVRLDQPQVMGILNMTPDSFSGGSDHLEDPAAATGLGIAMAADGAAIIDVGGESTRPGADTVWEEDEKARVLPVIEQLARAGTAVSVDTRKAGVMEAALGAGAQIINDVSALLFDDRALSVVAQADCPVVLMHFPGTPDDPHSNDGYAEPLLEVYDWLEARVDAVVAAGVSRDRIILDPGIGFGKGVAVILALINGISLFHGLGCPVLIGASRKRLIGALSNEAPVERRLAGSLAIAMKAMDQGAQIIRVHDVFETVQAARIWRGARDQALTPTTSL